MIGHVSLAAPGPVGFAVGGLLLALSAGLWLWLRFSRRRFCAEVRAEVGFARGVVRVQQPRWHPSMGPHPVEPVTELLPRCADAMDATLLIPRQREMRRG